MNSLTTLVQALGVAFASGISPYATVALAGLASRMGWIDSLPGALGAVSHPGVIVLASALTLMEFLATLIPGIASVWETIHTAIRPPAAAALAVLTAWHGDPAIITAAALLGGGLGFATHATKLGLRYTIDTSPEPVTNGAANIAELGVVATIAYTLWHHPYLTLAGALIVLVLLMLLVRTIFRAAKRALRGLRPAAPTTG
jgi:Domain of unknown function (DUF4126)